MTVDSLVRTLSLHGYKVYVHPNNHIRILRSRKAEFNGPRVISWWPTSRRRTAYDENCDHSWAPATLGEVIDAMKVDEDQSDPNVRAVS